MIERVETLEMLEELGSHFKPEDIAEAIDKEGICYCKAHGLRVGIYVKSKAETIFAIDPDECFDKFFTCSIIFCTPTSKREYKRFKKMLQNIIWNKEYRERYFEESADYVVFYDNRA